LQVGKKERLRLVEKKREKGVSSWFGGGAKLRKVWAGMGIEKRHERRRGADVQGLEAMQCNRNTRSNLTVVSFPSWKK